MSTAHGARTHGSSPGARARRAAGLLAGLALLLSGCMVPGQILPYVGGGPRIGADDVITVTEPAAGMFGYFGEAATIVGPATITSRYTVPEGGVIFEVTRDLEAGEREAAVGAAADYVAWERRLDERDRQPCTDIASDTVEISGELAHSSTVQDCRDGTPLRELVVTFRDLEDPRLPDLARPSQTWRFAIGADEQYTTELTISEGYTLTTADGAPRQLGWTGTTALLAPLNTLILDESAAGTCPEATEQLVMTRLSSPEFAVELPLCPTGPTAEIAQVLRGA